MIYNINTAWENENREFHRAGYLKPLEYASENCLRERRMKTSFPAFLHLSFLPSCYSERCSSAHRSSVFSLYILDLTSPTFLEPIYLPLSVLYFHFPNKAVSPRVWKKKLFFSLLVSALSYLSPMLSQGWLLLMNFYQHILQLKVPFPTQ